MRGNEALKANDLQTALQEYHGVIFKLKGLDSSVANLYGQGGPAAPVKPDGDKLKELSPELLEAYEKEEARNEIKGKISEHLKFSYLNMAVVLIKKEKWKRALECALEVQKIDPDNFKAKFREAQARIGLGEISKGKKMMEDLQKTNPDIALTAALKQLALDEKARSAKSNAQFKGMYSKPSSSAPPPGKPVPKFEEIVDEPEVAKVQEEAKVQAAT
ncbi:tetratricopeptide repeat protein 9C [Pseudohyphozyma bogoriensis]|nr:tetratricopeptide repeat protein 9C [Pseudohyphozyma bogoriensis]